MGIRPIMRRVLFVAGEASGDLHAAGVAAALRRIRPELNLAAVGGARLAEQGVELIHRDNQLGVMGFLEVLKHVPRHFLLLRAIRKMLERDEISLVILIDYPGFNMKVGAAAERAGVPVLYYVTPQVWAWGAGRIPKLAQFVTKAAVILPFEEALLRGYGVDATFVGHPLLDRAHNMPTRVEAREALRLPQNMPVLALFPGSRQQEIDRLIDDFVATARELQGRISGLQVIVSVAPTVALDSDRCPFRLVHSASLSVLRAADAALCKSGTTTLEASIADCPLVVAYRTGRISFALAKRLVKVANIGLVNVVAGRQVAREFIQDEIVPARVADALGELLDNDSPERRDVLNGLAEVRAKLGTPGAAERVARMAGGLVGTSG
ncbi:MAG TPA: lipid-A-disaccharide synthase [Gemmatimonadaceae bacterium]|nr:lipid-A-disaccharide synthase [Gemmatimonadaceae bacterium]